MANRISDTSDTQKRKGGRKSVLLVDDHPLVREGLATMISATRDLVVVGEAGCANEAYQQLTTNVPDLVMIDLSMPGMNGIDLIKDVHEKFPRVRVLVLSMHEENVYAARALRAGAQGYIMKQASSAEIIEAVRTVLRGEVYVSPVVASRLLKMIADGDIGMRQRNSVDDLSNRELQVLTSIGNGLATQEIADQLHLNVKTIQTYREHIKRKLTLRNATDLTHYATQWVQSQGKQDAK